MVRELICHSMGPIIDSSPPKHMLIMYKTCTHIFRVTLWKAVNIRRYQACKTPTRRKKLTLYRKLQCPVSPTKKKAVVESQIPKKLAKKTQSGRSGIFNPPKTLTSKHKWSISSADPVETARSSPFGPSCPSPTICSRQQGREMGDVVGVAIPRMCN